VGVILLHGGEAAVVYDGRQVQGCYMKVSFKTANRGRLHFGDDTSTGQPCIIVHPLKQMQELTAKPAQNEACASMSVRSVLKTVMWVPSEGLVTNLEHCTSASASASGHVEDYAHNHCIRAWFCKAALRRVGCCLSECFRTERAPSLTVEPYR
jgi:hypothetical protein